MEWRHLLLFAIVCSTWVPLFLNRSFVNWDDDENYTHNPLLTNGRSTSFTFHTLAAQLLTPVLGTLEPFSNLIKVLVAFVSQWQPRTSSARPFLLCNLFFHAINTILISKLTTVKLQRHKTQLQWNRFNLLLPLFFALHPLRVESVAWASCLPYELATFWCLVGCILHEKHCTTSTTSIVQLMKGVCFLLAILSKASSCTVPFALLAYDLIQVGHGRVTFRHVCVSLQRHLLSVCLSCAGVLLAIGANKETPVVDDFSFDRKIVRASYAWWWYLVKSIVPYPLNVIYILPLGSTPGLDILTTPYVTGWIPLAIPLAMTTLVLLWSMWVLGKATMTTTTVASTKALGIEATASGANTKPTQKKKQERSAIMQSIHKNNTTQKPPTTPSLTTSPPFSPSFAHRCATVVVVYTIVLLPCLGFVQHGYLTMAADRYSYLVSAVVLVPFFTIELDNLMSFYSSSLLFRRRIGTLSKNQKFHSKVITVLGCVVLGVYGKQMRVQLNVWQTSTRLWEHASALQPRSIEILGNLAQAYSLALRPKKALATYKKALAMEAMNPVNANQESAELRHMYGQALRQSPSMTDKEFARIQYEKALTLDSMLSETLVSLAWWHEEFKPEDHGAMSLMYYQQAENMALYSLTEEGKLKRKTTGSKTMPHKVLRDASFWLSYG